MNKYIFTILLLIVSCSTQSQIVIKKIDNKELVELLIFGELHDLNKLQSDIEKQLWVKLYKLPNSEDNKCFPESHGVCNYKYYIATSQLDDSPTINAYNLGTLGEIIEIHWEKSLETDKAIINIKSNKYSKEALSYNKDLKNIITNYKAIITPTTLILTNGN